MPPNPAPTHVGPFLRLPLTLSPLCSSSSHKNLPPGLTSTPSPNHYPQQPLSQGLWCSHLSSAAVRDAGSAGQVAGIWVQVGVGATGSRGDKAPGPVRTTHWGQWQLEEVGVRHHHLCCAAHSSEKQPRAGVQWSLRMPQFSATPPEMLPSTASTISPQPPLGQGCLPRRPGAPCAPHQPRPGFTGSVQGKLCMWS